jgi:hypothetical protein
LPNRQSPEVSLADQIRYLVAPWIVYQDENQSGSDRFHETYRQIKVLLSPMTPPNFEIEKASAQLLSDHGSKCPVPTEADRSAPRTSLPAEHQHVEEERGEEDALALRMGKLRPPLLCRARLRGPATKRTICDQPHSSISMETDATKIELYFSRLSAMYS